MKPPQFDYEAPESVEAAVEILAGNADAKVLAGGQSLLPILSLRLTHPELLIDLRRIEGLDQISRSNGSVAIGAMATQHAGEHNKPGDQSDQIGVAGQEILDRLPGHAAQSSGRRDRRAKTYACGRAKPNQMPRPARLSPSLFRLRSAILHSARAMVPASA